MRFFFGVGIILFSAEQHRTHVGVFETWSNTNVDVDFSEWWKAAFDSIVRVFSTAVVTQHGKPSPECVPLANLRLRFSGMVRPEDICTKGHPPLSGGQSCEASRVGRWTC